MGLIRHKDLFSSKYNTAVICDENNRSFFIPIKYTIGNFFLARIQNLLYCFKIQHNRMKTYRDTAVKTCNWFYYDTNNYNALDAANVKALEDILKVNDLPNVEKNLLSTFMILSRKEGKKFKEHDILDVIAAAQQDKEHYQKEVMELENYLSELGTNKIVTPVKKVTEFLTEELIAPDPQFFGSVVESAIKLDAEHKKVTNTPISSKGAWMKWALLIMVVGMIGGLGYYGYSSGAFNHLIPNIGSQPTTSSDIMKQYPDPCQLKMDIQSGKIKLESLPAEVQTQLGGVKLPCTPAIPQH